MLPCHDAQAVLHDGQMTEGARGQAAGGGGGGGGVVGVGEGEGGAVRERGVG